MRKLTNTLLATTMLALLAPACSATSDDTSVDTSAAGEAEDGLCTLIGCLSSVVAKWDNALEQRLGELPYTVEACLDDRCSVAVVQNGNTMARASGCSASTDSGAACCTVDPRQEGLACVADKGGNVSFLFDLDPRDLKAQPPVVRLTATDALGFVVLSGERLVRLDSFYPNGPACEPTCYHGQVTFDSND